MSDQMNRVTGRCFLLLIISVIYGFSDSGIYAEEEIEAIVGHNVTIHCPYSSENVRWSVDGKNLTTKSDKRIILSTLSSDEFDENQQKKFTQTLNIRDVKISDAGNYSCQNHKNENEISFNYLQPIIQPTVKKQSLNKVRLKVSQKVNLFCLIELFPFTKFNEAIKWIKEDVERELIYEIKNFNQTLVNVTLNLNDVSKKDNGTYIVMIGEQRTDCEISIFILEPPQVRIDYLKAVGAQEIFMNWTINDGNDPVQTYFIQYMKEGSTTYTYYEEMIGGKNTSFVLQKFQPKTKYFFKISAKNSISMGPAYEHLDPVETLAEDPNFVPYIEVKGNTHSTITIGWTPPPVSLLDYIHYYELIVAEAAKNDSGIQEAIHPQNDRNLPYMFDNLKTATEYVFKVRACNELTKLCGNWSEIVSGTTMDGISSEPLNVSMSCSHFNISGRNTVLVTWDTPKQPNGRILRYQITLLGWAYFRSEKKYKNDTLPIKTIIVDSGKPQRGVFEGVPPNTNYSISISAITRSKKLGAVSQVSCTMPATAPDNIGRLEWGKIQNENDDYIFQLYLSRISERNGQICCYRIYLIKIGEQNEHLKSPGDLDIMTYHEVHAANNSRGGAYMAEVFYDFVNEVFLGDGKRVLVKSNDSSTHVGENCLKLWKPPKRKVVTTTTTTTTTPAPLEIEDIPGPFPSLPDNTKDNIFPTELAERRRRKRQPDPEPQPPKPNSIQTDEDINSSQSTPPPTISIDSTTFDIFDGPLDPSSNYTGFIEILVQTSENQVVSAYSEYFPVMKAGAPIIPYDESDSFASILNIVIQVLCALILLVLLLVTALCFMHRHYNKKATAQGDEMISLRDSLRALCGGRNNHNHHRHLIGSSSSKPPDMAPIPRADLPQAFVVRHKDSDYGFQHEFEMLPDRFNDRTTKHSEAKENVYKNRYPDIKSYDQTRVRMALQNQNLGSDYINANFVLGYKERKKFICAQGPMDSTVNDFWRMIWEQHLEIIVMLTNLEEYNKTKCAKYWPEKVTDSIQYGDISVTYSAENRFSDYLVRELRVARRNSNGDEEEERRTITQYHYLMWKDFMAPEHPHGIIKFMKQINSVYSLQRGPILIHCSAGVGRTGTLVALDSLSQQLNDEGHVSIFNTVCDMRHQRNFLVQSLKQYIFLYRSLMEIAQFGNTEMPAKGLGGLIEILKAKPNDSKEKCKLELEYEKLKSVSDDSKKSCAVGNHEENLQKNRSEIVIPFDRNRVILTPIPTKEHSTYINASFIEGYDNSESFIIAQDPLDSTISDFWRMISEQGIKTIVVISEIGDGPRKCPRYWADDEIQYDHILVKYIQSESCPYYTRREFSVINCKNDDTISVTQFQYNAWPTVEGEVPEVTRGMIELVDQAQKHHCNDDGFTSSGPMAVHCSTGTDRSSIFVALCIIVQQLRLEKKIDICTTIRKLRSQRNMLIDTYAQYEFLHRAIVNYADLHRLSLDSPSTSDC